MDKVKKNKKLFWLAVCIIAVLAVFVCVLSILKEGKRLSLTAASYVTLSKEDGKLIFNSAKGKDIVYSYNPQNGKLQKNKIDDSPFETDNYKFLSSENGLVSVNKNTGEEHYVLDLEKAKQEDGLKDEYGVQSFSFSNFQGYKDIIYFKYCQNLKISDNKEWRFCKYNAVDKTLQEVNTSSKVGGYILLDNNVYFLGSLDNQTVIGKIDIITDEETILVSYNKDEYDDSNIYNLKVFEKGLCYAFENKIGDTRYYKLCWYEFESGKLNYVDMPNYIYPFDYNDEQDAFYVLCNQKKDYTLHKIDAKLCQAEKICDDVISLVNPKYGMLTNIISINDKIYFGAQPLMPSDDSYTVYSLDANGKIEIIKSESKSFLRNFFPYSLR